MIAQVQEAGAADVDLAVKAARKAFEIGSEWRTMDPSARGQLINKLASLMRRDINELAVFNTPFIYTLPFQCEPFFVC